MVGYWLVIFGWLTVATLSTPCSEADREWENFQTRFNRTYSDREENKYRRKILEKNFGLVAEHNAKFLAGKTSFKIGINKFSDMTFSEVERILLGLEPRTRHHLEPSPAFSGKNPKIPESLDYRKLGVVTGVKDQDECSSSWAYATAGMLEAQYALATKKLVSLSVQQLIDCSPNNNQCRGGFVEDALLDLFQLGGISTEKSYPSTNVDGPCQYNSSLSIAKVNKFYYTKRNNEIDLKKVVATVGPVVVSIEVTADLLEYSSGIYYGENCLDLDFNLNHAMLVVGYGSESGIDYWILKNSWGKAWGEDGYMRMVRNNDSNCQIASSAMYATIEIV